MPPRKQNIFHIKTAIVPKHLGSPPRENEFPFEVLAELVDNASDAGANSLRIYNGVNSKYGDLLYFHDNGEGMEPLDLQSAVINGHSTRREKKTLIGKFGYGFKSLLYLFNDMIIFTRKNNYLSVAFLTKTVRTNIYGDAIYVAFVSYQLVNGKFQTRFDLTEGETSANSRHNSNLYFITENTPFESEENIQDQFFKIDETGTVVVLFNQSKNEENNTHHYFKYNPEIADIILTKPYEELNYILNTPRPIKAHNETLIRSFRKYLSILYKYPRMLIYINNSKVETMILETKLCYGKSFTYRTKLFNNQLKEIIGSAIEEHFENVKALDHESNELSTLNNIKGLIGQDKLNRINCHLVNLARLKYEVSKDVELIRNMILESARKHDVILKFGLNLYDPDMSACVVYCNGRLVKILPEIKHRKKDNYEYKGIIVIIEIPFSVLDKRRFTYSTELRYFETIISDYEENFIRETRTDLARQTYEEFWTFYGFGRMRNEQESTYISRRLEKMLKVAQCENCLRWRKARIDENRNYTCCFDLTGNKKSCDHPEELVKLVRGKHVIPEDELPESAYNSSKYEEHANNLIERFEGIATQTVIHTEPPQAFASLPVFPTETLGKRRPGRPKKNQDTSGSSDLNEIDIIKRYSSHDFMKKSFTTPKETDIPQAFNMLAERLRSLLNKISEDNPKNSKLLFSSYDNMKLIHFNFEKYILDKISRIKRKKRQEPLFFQPKESPFPGQTEEQAYESPKAATLPTRSISSIADLLNRPIPSNSTLSSDTVSQVKLIPLPELPQINTTSSPSPRNESPPRYSGFPIRNTPSPTPENRTRRYHSSYDEAIVIRLPSSSDELKQEPRDFPEPEVSRATAQELEKKRKSPSKERLDFSSRKSRQGSSRSSQNSERLNVSNQLVQIQDMSSLSPRPAEQSRFISILRNDPRELFYQSEDYRIYYDTVIDPNLHIPVKREPRARSPDPSVDNPISIVSRSNSPITIPSPVTQTQTSTVTVEYPATTTNTTSNSTLPLIYSVSSTTATTTSTTKREQKTPSPVFVEEIQSSARLDRSLSPQVDFDYLVPIVHLRELSDSEIEAEFKKSRTSSRGASNRKSVQSQCSIELRPRRSKNSRQTSDEDYDPKKATQKRSRGKK